MFALCFHLLYSPILVRDASVSTPCNSCTTRERKLVHRRVLCFGSNSCLLSTFRILGRHNAPPALQTELELLRQQTPRCSSGSTKQHKAVNCASLLKLRLKRCVVFSLSFSADPARRVSRRFRLVIATLHDAFPQGKRCQCSWCSTLRPRTRPSSLI